MNSKTLKNALLLSSFIGLSVTSINSLATDHSPLAFPDKNLTSWKERSFAGNTQYQIITENGANILKAVTSGTASVLYKQNTIDLTKSPWLAWSWKIDAIYKDINEQTKGGDDFPVRLYVVAKTGFLPWQTIAINYVWSSHQPVGTSWLNPYTDKATMVVVQSGEDAAGNWVSQKRNIVEDFKRYFDRDITQIAGYAVMVDGDNSSQTGTAYFGNIDFLTE